MTETQTPASSLGARRGRPPGSRNVTAQPRQTQPQQEAAPEQINDLPDQDFGPRPKRRFGALRQKLKVDPIPGYVQRWINDIPGRIDDAIDCGYSHVNDSQNKPIYRVVGAKKTGGELRAYRMKIPKVWYDEAKAEEQEEFVDSVENDIWQGKASRMVPGQNGAYVPTQGPGGPSRINVTTSIK